MPNSTQNRTARKLPQQQYQIVRKRVASLKPSPENLKIYAPVVSTDPEIVKLADSIRERGLHEPLIVTADGFIVSGHRRHAALLLIGQVIVTCRVLRERRDQMTTDAFITLLREHNRQRYKNAAEQLREELVDIDPAEALARLQEERDNSVNWFDTTDIAPLKIEGNKVRFGISDQKAEHVKYAKKVIFEDRKDYWPLSVRGIHYPLLNYKFFRNIPRKLKYANDEGSYQATSDLLTRLRLTDEIPWEAITDGTRPVTRFRPFSNAIQFVRQEVSNILTGYWRDLLQSQPNWVEVVVEKNTVYHMALRITQKYQIPTSSGRGFCSIDPWHEMACRYENSGRERLIVIVLSDWDPEGEQITQVGGRTLRDDFGVQKLDIIKAGVTRDQINDYDLPKQNFAKESSSNHDWFVGRNDGDDSVYELEALEPRDMLNDLETVITSVLDMDLFNAEAERETEEAAFIMAAQKTALKALKGLVE